MPKLGSTTDPRQLSKNSGRAELKPRSEAASRDGTLRHCLHYTPTASTTETLLADAPPQHLRKETEGIPKDGGTKLEN